MRASELRYKVIRHNSNSAVGGLPRTSGAQADIVDRLLNTPLFAVRLPGIAFRLWSDDTGGQNTQPSGRVRSTAARDNGRPVCRRLTLVRHIQASALGLV